MNRNSEFQRLAATTAINSVPLAVVSVVALFLAVNSNFGRLFGRRDTSDFRRARCKTAALGYDLRYSWLLFAHCDADTVLRRWLHPLDPYRMGLYTICLLAYSLIRASGAAITSAVMPPMIEADMS